MNPVPSRSSWLCGSLLVVAVLAAWCNSFDGPFLFDDVPAIARNETIRHLGTSFMPPAGGATVAGRPLLNFSFAVDYAVSGQDVRGYHVTNLIIHALAGLVLFGLVRRTLQLPGLAPRLGPDARTLAFAVALLWVVHPLQTESVTYLAQRAESLAGLLVLLALYCFVRGCTDRLRWFVGTVVCAMLGVGCKETAAVTPVLALLFDRTFVAGSFREALRRRWVVHAGMAGSWLVFGALRMGDLGRGGTAGFEAGVSSGSYALTQAVAVTDYLKLAIWPRPLVFDYGTPLFTAAATVALPALALAALFVGSVWALWRRPWPGYLGAWFFVTLAPSSSFVPIVSQTMAEHRIYLALAAPLTVVVLLLHRFAPRWTVAVCAALGVMLTLGTIVRNRDYRSEFALWSDTVAKRPDNARAHFILGRILAERGEQAAALAHYREALGIDARNAEVHLAVGDLLLEKGDLGEAQVQLAEAAQLAPHSASMRFGFANALARSGHLSEAIVEYEQALRLRPDFAVAHTNLGNTLLLAGRAREAVAHYEAALRSEPTGPRAHYNLATALAQSGESTAAIEHYRFALQGNPALVDARYNLAGLLLAAGAADEAVAEYQVLLSQETPTAPVLNKLGNALVQAGRIDAAMASYGEALRLAPDLADTHYNLANLLAAHGRTDEAITHYEATLRLDPRHAEAHTNLGTTLAELGRTREAVDHFEAATQIFPRNPGMRINLAHAQLLLGRVSDAQRTVEEALRLDPGNLDARELLAQIRTR